MERDELLKLKKDELADKVIELSTTEAGKAIAERDAALSNQSEQATRITDLETELNDVRGSLEEMKGKLADMDTDEEKAELSRQVNDLTERLAANVATKGDPRPVVKVRDKHMLFVAQRFLLPDGRTMTAEAAMKDPKLMDQLVDSGSAVLKEVPINN